jgi:hypothetical protein
MSLSIHGLWVVTFRLGLVLPDVSKYANVFIIRVKHSKKKKTQSHASEDWDLQQHSCHSLSSLDIPDQAGSAIV